RYRSRGMESLLNEARSLVKEGIKELIIIAQDTTKYGNDLVGDINLTKLLKELCSIEELKWIRIQYCYPDGITHELLDLISQEDRICKYLDMPLQHVNKGIIDKMNRNFSGIEAADLIQKIRRKIPDMVIRTTFIAGFPGEGQQEFDEMKEFIQENPFNHAGVFAYSREEGTPAAEYTEQLDDKTKKERRNSLMSIQQTISKRLNSQWVGEVWDVLIEGEDSPGIFIGRHYGQSPEIDGCVYVFSSKDIKPGDFIKVKMTKSYDYDLLGEHYEFAE
ncbi:MAG TPA: MiaB/RimO family radical SAM methylthiotransferase, partial [Clostridia bacterium]|nr:MiaB/RimO family radical SAM methylthiotransferase [Clostridia bacterium]